MTNNPLCSVLQNCKPCATFYCAVKFKFADISARHSEGSAKKVLMKTSSIGARRATPTSRQLPCLSSLLPVPPRNSPCVLSVVSRVSTMSGGGRYNGPAEK